jgi:predicted nucleic acid-binding protein
MSYEGGAVLLDTDVWSKLFILKGTVDPRVETWKTALVGRPVVIATQTRAELLQWPELHTWGQPKKDALEAQLNATPTIPVDESVTRAYVRLTVSCKHAGLGLFQKVHCADRWIAATAIAHNLPLLTGDDNLRAAPGVKSLQP